MIDKEFSNVTLFISAESAERAALKSVLASQAQNDGPIMSIIFDPGAKGCSLRLENSSGFALNACVFYFASIAFPMTIFSRRVNRIFVQNVRAPMKR
jgi:hypothetical protein